MHLGSILISNVFVKININSYFCNKTPVTIYPGISITAYKNTLRYLSPAKDVTVKETP